MRARMDRNPGKNLLEVGVRQFIIVFCPGSFGSGIVSLRHHGVPVLALLFQNLDGFLRKDQCAFVVRLIALSCGNSLPKYTANFTFCLLLIRSIIIVIKNIVTPIVKNPRGKKSK